MNNSGKPRQKKYLEPAEAAEFLMVTPITVRRWANKGLLKSLQTPGGHRRFLRHDVEDFARERGIHASEEDRESTRILIVDDDPEIIKFLSKMLTLRIEGVQTEVADGGFIAGMRVKEFKPDIILLDLKMPDLSGIELCKILKSSPETKNIRIIGMSGFDSDESREEFIEAGAEAFMPKPISADMLVELISV